MGLKNKVTLRPKLKPRSIPQMYTYSLSFVIRGCDFAIDCGSGTLVELGNNGRTKMEFEHACVQCCVHHRGLLLSTITGVEAFLAIPRKIRSNRNPFRATAISLRNQVLPTAPRPLQFLGATHVPAALPHQHRPLGWPPALGPNFPLLRQRRRHRMVRPEHWIRLGNRPSIRGHGGFPRSKPPASLT